jgi:acyl-CoA thioester hydrolase
MADFHFFLPIQVRYNDLDAQWHVNNANFLTYLEQTRTSYLVELGLFDGKSFFDIGLIVADVHIAYLAPIEFGQTIQVALRVARIGNKSLTMEYEIQDRHTGQVCARAETVMVAYDYHHKASRPVPDEWRKKIESYEGLSQPG